MCARGFIRTYTNIGFIKRKKRKNKEIKTQTNYKN